MQIRLVCELEELRVVLKMCMPMPSAFCFLFFSRLSQAQNNRKSYFLRAYGRGTFLTTTIISDRKDLYTGHRKTKMSQLNSDFFGESTERILLEAKHALIEVSKVAEMQRTHAAAGIIIILTMFHLLFHTQSVDENVARLALDLKQLGELEDASIEAKLVQVKIIEGDGGATPRSDELQDQIDTLREEICKWHFLFSCKSNFSWHLELFENGDTI